MAKAAWHWQYYERQYRELTPIDIDALNRCIEFVCSNPVDKVWIEAKLASGTEHWLETARSACSDAQGTNLSLGPGDERPFQAQDDDNRLSGDDIHGIREAIALRDRLLQAGLSKYDPNPEATLQIAERSMITPEMAADLERRRGLFRFLYQAFGWPLPEASPTRH